MRFYSPKFSLRLPVCPRDAGEWMVLSLDVVVYALDSSIVEFASPEDAQRAIRELSEQPLLGRPVFIREVSCLRGSGGCCLYIHRHC